MSETNPDGVPTVSRGSRRLARLFKVLVLGGAVIAAGYASTIQGGTGTPNAGGDDGGTQGW